MDGWMDGWIEHGWIELGCLDAWMLGCGHSPSSLSRPLSL